MSAPLLLRSPNWLGDAVMALPAVRSLRRGLPGAELVVAAPASLAALWRACPAVDRVVPLPRPRSYRATVPLLRAAGPKRALLFPNSFRSALEMRLAGVHALTGLGHAGRRFLLPRAGRVAPRPFSWAALHQQFEYLHLAAALGGDGDAGGPEPLLRAGEGSREGVLLCPGAAYGPAKRWPAARFAEVGRALAALGLGPVFIHGAPGDRAAAAEVAAGVPGAVNRAGETTPEEFLAAVAGARLVVTNDSGAMHVAAACGTPGVAVFGSTEPRRTGPLGESVRVVREHVPCSPCFLRECPLDFACMERVTVGRVLAACEEALA
ncbi:MAG: lipopolysaccharide heptosyltransferase II [Verrucomicrobium sp.]|nr:lipopolysaccharide heptosyltransferase II [Verrucomicrobium sp.]